MRPRPGRVPGPHHRRETTLRVRFAVAKPLIDRGNVPGGHMWRSTRHLRPLGVVITVVVLLLAGCARSDNEISPELTRSMRQAQPPSYSPTSPTQHGSPSADSEVVTWMGGFCAELGKLAQLAEVNPPEVETGDIAGAQQAFGKIIDKFEGTLGSFLSGLRDLPPAPRSAGDKAKQDLIDTFEPVREKLTDIGDTLEAAAPDDKQAVVDVTEELDSVLSSLENIDGPLQR